MSSLSRPSPRRGFLALLAAATLGLALAPPAVAHDDKPQPPPVDVPGDSSGAISENVEFVEGRNGFTGGHLVTRGDRLYLGSYAIGMRIYDISDREAPEVAGAWQPLAATTIRSATTTRRSCWTAIRRS